MYRICPLLTEKSQEGSVDFMY